MPDKAPSLLDCFAEIRNPDIYKNFLIHLFVMIPAAGVISVMGVAIDRFIGFVPYLPSPWHWVLAGVFLATGVIIVVYSYGYLAILGEGSPGTHIDEGTKRMVVTGPYTVIRHPSVVGKLAGVLGLGIATRSVTFTFVIIPLLLVYSLITNRYLQERYCESKFGDVYRRYRAIVPMLLPRPAGIKRWFRGEPAMALGQETQRYEPVGRDPSADTRPVRELPMYLAMLGGIIAVAAAAMLLIKHLFAGG